MKEYLFPKLPHNVGQGQDMMMLILILLAVRTHLECFSALYYFASRYSHYFVDYSGWDKVGNDGLVINVEQCYEV